MKNMQQEKTAGMDEVYGPGTKILSKDENCTVYLMENHTGTGTMTRYSVLPGIDIYYNDIHMSDSFAENKVPRTGMVEINHCLTGRFECEFPNRTVAYLGEGDLAINMLTNVTRAAWFPLSSYRGISVMLDIPTASKALLSVSEALGGMAFDLSCFDRLCAGNTCFIMRSTDAVQHIFSELYTAPEKLRSSYVKIKIMELLLLLGSENLLGRQDARPYFRREQVDTVKKIREYLISRLDRHITLPELSDRFRIPVTSMKLCFKGVYGCSVSQYMQSYRMHTAALRLRQTGASVTEIAGQVGYVNVSKFSAAFKQHMGISPLEYRKKNVPPE